jgi:hypothetical protein
MPERQDDPLDKRMRQALDLLQAPNLWDEASEPNRPTHPATRPPSRSRRIAIASFALLVFALPIALLLNVDRPGTLTDQPAAPSWGVPESSRKWLLDHLSRHDDANRQRDKGDRENQPARRDALRRKHGPKRRMLPTREGWSDRGVGKRCGTARVEPGDRDLRRGRRDPEHAQTRDHDHR